MPRTTDFREVLARAAESYKRALIGHQPGLTWDYLVLTAANEHQAEGYRHEIGLRSNPGGPLGGFFPASQRTLVVADPPGFRAGSGGATLGVLRAIARQESSSGVRNLRPFGALRILVIHSGGASQRLPLFSALGKIFTPLPMVRPDGQLMTLLDHLYLLMAGMPARLGPGMLVAAGDVFLIFDGSSIVTPPPPGVTALAIRTPEQQALGHGVFRVGAVKESEYPLVVGTMQKGTVGQLREAGFTDGSGGVLIDSGLLFFDPGAVSGLHELSRHYTPGWQRKHLRQIDIYTDIAPAAMVGSAPGESADSITRRLHADLQAALRGHPLRCLELPGGAFLHIGTTRQFRETLTGRGRGSELFRHNVRFVSASRVPASARVYQSVIATREARIGRGAVVENCLIEMPVSIGAGAIVSGLSIRRQEQRVEVPANIVVYGVRVRAGREIKTVPVVLGVDDDPKGDRTICNVPLEKWLRRAGLRAEDLWGRTGRGSLWTARLFAVEPKLSRAMWLARPEALTAGLRRKWLRARRYSLAEILELADPAAMANHRDAVSGALQAVEWVKEVKSGSAASVQNTIHHFGPRGYERLLAGLYEAARGGGLTELQRARLMWNVAEIEARQELPRGITLPYELESLRIAAFGHLRDAMAPPDLESRTSHLAGADEITASAPVRLDFAGGWTDTPPYCLENGGAVVNVALDLNGVSPIQTVFRRVEEPVVRLVSRDLGRMLVIDEPGELRRPVGPGDAFALHRMALKLTGLGPGARETSMRRYLGRLNGGGKARGFELETASNLPKGSGMGTSSILGATMLAVLRKAAGLDAGEAALFEQTLLLEQHLGTGGGWQDQVGGIVGGAKMTTTRPGVPQRLRVERIGMSRGAGGVRGLEERLVVYFTGQQRLARDILRQVMGRYLSREPGAMVAFEELKANARACREALSRGDFLGVAAEINHYWRLKKDLYPGSTTAAADGLFAALRPYYLASCLAGAGGGGFAFFLCRDGDQALRLRKELAAVAQRPGSLGLTFHAGVNRNGLRIN